MEGTPATPRALRPHRVRWSFGRLVTRVLCLLFAVIGAIPLSAGFLVRTSWVRAWAARETANLITRALGVTARYDVAVQAFPMLLALDNVVVDASDGGPPFLRVERVAVHPRPFSLLAGKLDAGDVEIIGPRVRAVVEQGALKNLTYKLPAAEPGKSSESMDLPIASASITDGRLDARIDGTRVDAREIDADLSPEDGAAFELAIRAGESTIVRAHPFPGREADEDAVDEDVICRLDARVRVEGRRALVRRLTLQGSVDFDPDPGTTPSCTLTPHDFRAVELRLGAVNAHLGEDGKLQANGRVYARAPAALVHRFVDVPPLAGALTVDIEANYDDATLLPRATGHVSAESPSFDGKVLSKHIDLDVSTDGSGVVSVEKVTALWADGKVTIPELKLDLVAKGVTLKSGPVTVEGLELAGLLRDLGVHPQSHVAWTLEHGRLDGLHGTLNPLLLQTPLSVSTRGFEIFDRPASDPARGHMLSVKEGSLRGLFVVSGDPRSKQYRTPGVVFSNFGIDTPASHLRTTVTIGFDNTLGVQIFEGSTVDLAEISPLASLPLTGQASLRLGVAGPVDRPRVTGDLAIKDFSFAGFAIGELESARVSFTPLKLNLEDARIRHGQSRIRAPLTRIAFDEAATVLVDSDVDTREAPHLRLKDLFEIMHVDKDPRWADIDATASGKTRVHFALGGREDRCGGGLVDVRASAELSDVSLLGERYASGTVDADLIWDDLDAGADGMRLDLRSLTLRKGTGGILANATVRHGGALQGSAIMSSVPIASLDALGAYGKLFDGSASVVAEIGGTLHAITATADVNVSRIRIGPSSLPPSHLRVAVEPTGPPPKVLSRTRCNNPVGSPFDPAEFEKDIATGLYRVNGTLFDGQVKLDDLRITNQNHKLLEGKIGITELDLGTLANLIPGVAFAGAAPKGSLSATLDVKSLPFDATPRAEVELALQRVVVERDGALVQLDKPSGVIQLKGNELAIPDLRLSARLASGLSASIVAGGQVHRAMTAPDVDLSATLLPIDLAKVSAEIAGVERAAGSVDAVLRITGPTAALRYDGAAHMRGGDLDIKGLPVGIQGVHIDVEIGGGDVRLRRAEGKVGGGSIAMTGRMPLRGPEAGAASANITARGVKLPLSDGIVFTADADLEASYKTGERDGEKNLPDVKGTVSLTSFRYTRPIALSLDLNRLGRGQKKTEVDTYDPSDDLVHFDVTVVSPRPLRFANDLIDMELEVTSPGLVLSGTNQRFGARGQLKILPDSKVQLRSSEFLVREGTVRFEDPMRISPKIDVRAQTEYRRYTSTAVVDPTAGGTSASSSGAGGLWRITLQAHGDTDNLKVSLSSDPTLSQEDIILLLTIGLTQAELDRVGVASVASAGGLEVLSALTGADKAVKTIVPLIDEFRFGSSYSSKTGRTEPTVTIGKRITDDVRASVTAGITENREVRSNLEWRLNRRVSVQGSYDNVNDVSSSQLGNIGADFRFRLEFE
jgi:translocation and assembly module TamB